jgi:hypothetical protein
VELLACWKRRFSQNNLNVVWNVIPFCLMWCIWRKECSKFRGLQEDELRSTALFP